MTADQEAAIANKAPVRQEFYLLRPEDAAHTAFETYLFDAGVYGSGELRYVTNPGVRRAGVANHSPKVTGRLSATRWTVEVANRSGAFCRVLGSLWEHSTSGYLAVPQECYLEHRVYVRLSGAWSELTEVRWKGRVKDISYDDDEDPHGDPLPVAASLEIEDAGAAEAMRRIFTLDDAYDEQVDDPGGFGDCHWTVI